MRAQRGEVRHQEAELVRGEEGGGEDVGRVAGRQVEADVELRALPRHLAQPLQHEGVVAPRHLAVLGRHAHHHVQGHVQLQRALLAVEQRPVVLHQ